MRERRKKEQRAFYGRTYVHTLTHTHTHTRTEHTNHPAVVPGLKCIRFRRARIREISLLVPAVAAPRYGVFFNFREIAKNYDRGR